MIKDYWKKWKRKWLPYLIAYGGKALIRLLLKSCKIKVQGLENLTRSCQTSSCILMLWHNKLILVSEILFKYTCNITFSAFISKSRDGEPLALLASSYTRGRILRVPHNSRHIALAKLIDTLKTSREVVIITPDGPKGPNEVVKSGIALAAKNSSSLIIPFSWSSTRFWQLNTWDQMKIPKPFSTIHVAFGAPINLSAGIHTETLQDDTDTLQNDTRVLTEALKRLESTLYEGIK